MALYEPGHVTGQAIVKALGIDPGCHRIVIDVRANDVARVYVQRVMTKEEAAALVKVLQESGSRLRVEEVESVSVNADGFVTLVRGES